MSPRLIDERDEFALEKRLDNRNDTAKFLNKNPEKLLIKHWELYKIGNNIRLIENQETLYHVQFEVKHKKFWANIAPNAKQAIQVEVWKQIGVSHQTHGLPRAVFFEYLLPQYGMMVTDGLHTESGKRFWLDRLAEALDLGFGVYYGDYAQNICQKINDLDELREIYAETSWGNQNIHRYRRMAIVL